MNLIARTADFTSPIPRIAHKLEEGFKRDVSEQLVQKKKQCLHYLKSLMGNSEEQATKVEVLMSKDLRKGTKRFHL